MTVSFLDGVGAGVLTFFLVEIIAGPELPVFAVARKSVAFFSNFLVATAVVACSLETLRVEPAVLRCVLISGLSPRS